MNRVDRQFRYSVLPLAALFVIAGVSVPICAWIARMPLTSPFPFVESESLNRHLFGSIGLLCLGIGIGLTRRSRFAWKVMLAYLGLGIAVQFMSAFDDRYIAIGLRIGMVVIGICSGLISIGIYYVTRPVFCVAPCSEERDSDSANTKHKPG